ncbi:M48 family metalloprotease [Fretibacter rubidus]|uniref:M48 family metalloprotease n=1 Tax=Fretibacter rubidus TaxID=570162 RepID=UPI00352A2AAA
MPRLRSKFSRAVKTGAAALLASVVMVGASTSADAQSLLRDTEIEDTLEEFTQPILAAAGLNGSNVDLYIVNDPSLNAFVTRGQNIFLHSGLILQSDTPNQLKGVIAHEAGHIADGRIARSDYSNRSAYGAMLIAAGLGIAAILAGEGGAGAAILAGSQQFGALEVLAHTRVAESVADQYAAQYLERTGQSGEGLIQFFEKFRYQEVFSQARRYPYFRSHPLSSNRIDALREVVAESPYRDAVDSPEDIKRLAMTKAKLRGFLDAPQTVFRTYPESDQSDEARYARSVAYFKGADLRSAIREIDSLIADYPKNPYFYELKAQMLFESGQGTASIEPAERALALKPDAPLFEMALAQALIETADPVAVDRAVELLKSALQKERDNGAAWYHLSQAYGRQGNNALASYATAEQAFAFGDLNRARSFAERAQRDMVRNTPQYRRAADIVVISNTQLASRGKDRYRPKP